MTTSKIETDPAPDGFITKDRDYLSADEATAEEHGFVIKTNGRLYYFTLGLCQNDNNAATQRKIAEAINARDIGVTALVESNGNNGTSLSFSAKHSLIFYSPKPLTPSYAGF